MVLTEEQLDFLASLKVRARKEGLEEGRAEGKAEERNDTLAVLRNMKFSSEQISEFKSKLEALQSQK